MRFAGVYQLVQSRQFEPNYLDGLTETLSAYERFEQYFNQQVQQGFFASSARMYYPSTFTRLVVDGKDVDYLEQDLEKARQIVLKERYASLWDHIKQLVSLSSKEKDLFEARQKVIQHYLNKAESMGYVIDLDA